MMSIMGSWVRSGYRGVLGMTLGSNSLKKRGSLPSGMRIKVSMTRYSISRSGYVISTCLIRSITRDFLQQLQIVLRGDLQVRLNAHPILLSIVQKTSEQPLILFLQSSSLVVMPMGERSSRRLMWAWARLGNLMVKSSRRQELKEWQMNEQFLCLQNDSNASIVLRKKAQIYIIYSQLYCSSLLLTPIPRISHKITFPLAIRGRMNMKLMSALPPKPWPTQQFSQRP